MPILPVRTNTRPQSIWRVAGFWVRAGLGLMLIMALLGGVTLSWWRLQGKQVMTVQTGSMTPTLSIGDAVLVNTNARDSLQPGEVISYRNPSNPNVIVTHRLIAVNARTGWIITKGDALKTPDPTFPPRLVVGRAEAVLPKFGRVLTLLRSPLAVALIVYVPAGTIIILEIRRLARQLRQPHFNVRQVTSRTLRP